MGEPKKGDAKANLFFEFCQDQARKVYREPQRSHLERCINKQEAYLPSWGIKSWKQITFIRQGRHLIFDQQV